MIDQQWIEAARTALPELPAAKKERFIQQYDLPFYDAEVLTGSRELAEYFETCVEALNEPKLVSNWVMGPLLGLLNAEGKAIVDSPVSAPHLAQLLKLVAEGGISGKIAKKVFDETAQSGKAPKAVVEAKGLVQVSDAGEIEKVVRQVLDDHADQVAAYQGGKTKILGFFVGQVMKATRGKANPKMVNEILLNLLKE